jgi:hypothetical protein
MLETMHKERSGGNEKKKNLNDLKVKAKLFDKGFELSQMRFGGKLNINDFAKLSTG